MVYGLVGLKTHAKCILVVRDDDDGLRRYCHIGTGNYNSRTARLYEDIGLLTADEARRRRRRASCSTTSPATAGAASYRKLLVAPYELRSQLIDLIDQRGAAAEPTGGITAK